MGATGYTASDAPAESVCAARAAGGHGVTVDVAYGVVAATVWCAIRPLDRRVRFDLLLVAAAESINAAAATRWERVPLPEQFRAAAMAFGIQHQQLQDLQRQLQQGPSNPFDDEGLVREFIGGTIVPNVALRDRGSFFSPLLSFFSVSLMIDKMAYLFLSESYSLELLRISLCFHFSLCASYIGHLYPIFSYAD